MDRIEQLRDHVPETASQWYEAGQGAVIATVVATWGSAPRGPGSQMASSGGGDMVGSVSGGCVEAAVVLAAQEVLAEGRPRLLRFGVADETAFDVGLACGGEIEVLVEPVGPDAPAFCPSLLRDLVAARSTRRPVACVTDLTTWERSLMQSPERPLRSGRDAAGRMITRHDPPLRLIIVGAVHIAAALIPMAQIAGFAPILVDPREGFASASRFRGVSVVQDWPDAALAEVGLDARTAVVTLAHDEKLDDPAIVAALSAEVFYIGSLGSSRTHAKRLERMRALGISEAQLARIHAPVGLSINACTPSEIAVATLAQIIAVLRAE